MFTKVSGPVLEILGFSVNAKTKTDSSNLLTGWNDEERLALQAKIAARQPFLDFMFSRTNADSTLQKFCVSGEPVLNPASSIIGYRGIGVEVGK